MLRELMFTEAEREVFSAHGLLKRDAFLSRERLEHARSAVFEHLERVGIWRDGAWRLEQAAPDSGMALIKPLDRHPWIVELVSGDVQRAACELAGGQPVFGGHPGLLFTLPNAITWSLPHRNWHTDFPRLPGREIPGVQIFALLDSVEPRGGGTLAVMGSHRLLNNGLRISSADLRKTLRRERYFAELMSDGTHNRMRFLTEAGHVGDVALKVVEMTGEPGDVYFMDLRVLHAVSPNSLQTPRIMLTDRYLLDATRQALNGH